MNTLGISDRPIRTVLGKLNQNGFLKLDLRGKHINRKRVDPHIKQSVRDFIKDIPRVKSPLCKIKNDEEFIYSGKSLADIHRDYVQKQTGEGKKFMNFANVFKNFSYEFNISFFIPKKVQCNLCEAFKNSPEDKGIAEKFW
ncbi:unnamed protein product [Diabrotica balteata]|uniref:Uncharacterized protein n=1 Tax=Diabrotica balteata TaxID=107213 RepID=A0A9N9T559_DIABA|nr:unnamed protein product [Diabrotica balteata]